jgi:hypothetical protein
MPLLLAACFPDDWDGQPYVPGGSTGPDPIDTSDTAAPVAGIVGSWESEGSDLSDLFANVPFFYEYVRADFGANGIVSSEIRDSDGAVYVVTGTFVVDEGTQPASIVLQQTEPYIATLQGIYQVSGDTLTYEVVQLTPDYGYLPPTPEQGFGTTSGPNLVPGVNVQTYVRQ